jgi:hypothetical protein
LTEIKAYKPAVVQKIEVPTTFKAPAPPVKPVLETAPEVAVEAALAEEAWPELEDPIDNPELYNDEYDISTENDDGSLLPKRLKPVHYH